MTLASTLFGGGGNAPYMPGKLYPLPELGGVSNVISTIGRDLVFPIAPRRNAVLDQVAWQRDNTNAGNAYVGLYSSAGALLTDCAVDANTVVGWHTVQTTNVALVASQYYYLCVNLSEDIAGTMVAGSLVQGGNPLAGAVPYEYLENAGWSLDLGASGYFGSKVRTNAPLLSTLTLSGFDGVTSMPAMGLVFA